MDIPTPNPLPGVLTHMFPWLPTIRKILGTCRWELPLGGTLLVGSDYSGQTSDRNFEVFSFLVSDSQTNSWDMIRNSVRDTHLPDRRRISFKSVGNSKSRTALIPFLEAADFLTGELVSFAVAKPLLRRPFLANEFKAEKFGLSAKWKGRQFIDLLHKTLFVAMLADRWSTHGSNLTWITDQDNIVANAAMHDDALIFAAQLCQAISPIRRGILRVNTVADGGQDRYLEDYVSVSDLAAGALAELATKMFPQQKSVPDKAKATIFDIGQLQYKSQVVLDWHWSPSATLGRTCIVIRGIADKIHAFRLDRLG